LQTDKLTCLFHIHWFRHTAVTRMVAVIMVIQSASSLNGWTVDRDSSHLWTAVPFLYVTSSIYIRSLFTFLCFFLYIFLAFWFQNYYYGELLHNKPSQTKGYLYTAKSINLICPGPDRWLIIKYSRLSDSTYNDLCSYRELFVSAPIWKLKTNKRIIPLGYLLHLPVQGHQGPFQCFLESSRLQKLMEYKTRNETITLQFMYRHSWRPVATCHCDLPISLIQFFLVKSKTSNLWTTLKCWVIRISGLYRTRDYLIRLEVHRCIPTIPAEENKSHFCNILCSTED
jgi:hypothetical protein